MSKSVYIILYLLFSEVCFSKVFNLQSNLSGTYIRGNYGNSNLQQDSYIERSGSQTQVGGEMDYNLGAELGFFTVNQNIGYRLGLSVLSPQKISDTVGADVSSGTQLMNIASAVYGTFAVGYIDYYFWLGKISRAVLSVGGGYGRVQFKNNFTLTSAGSSTYGINTFQEIGETYTYIADISIGYEITFANSLSLILDGGYRYCHASGFEYKDSITNFAGSQTSGSSVLNQDGQEIKLDLSNFYSGISLRFYFNAL